jgi:hypothetical protein
MEIPRQRTGDVAIRQRSGKSREGDDASGVRFGSRRAVGRIAPAAGCPEVPLHFQDFGSYIHFRRGQRRKAERHLNREGLCSLYNKLTVAGHTNVPIREH